MEKYSKGFGHHQLGILEQETQLLQWSQLQQQEERGQRKSVVQAAQCDRPGTDSLGTGTTSVSTDVEIVGVGGNSRFFFVMTGTAMGTRVPVSWLRQVKGGQKQ